MRAYVLDGLHCCWLLMLGAALFSSPAAQAERSLFSLEVTERRALSIVGPVGVSSDFRLEFTETLHSRAEWQLLTNFSSLTKSPQELAFAGSEQLRQGFYRLSVAGGFSAPPHCQLTASGHTAELSGAIVPPGSPVSYQWRRLGLAGGTGADIPGATNSTLVLSNVTGAAAGLYSIVATAPDGFRSSRVILLSVEHPDTGIPYGIAEWPPERGNHRARLAVPTGGDAVWARVPWRRRDPHPELRDIWVFDAASGQRVMNVFRVGITREYAELMFQPLTLPGEYHVYYLPFEHAGDPFGPRTVYVPPSNTAELGWSNRCAVLAQKIALGATNEISLATVLEFQAASDFDRFDPMEVPATQAEVQALLQEHPHETWLLFAEERRYPIRMTEALPLRWPRRGVTSLFAARAARGEFFCFQAAVFAARQRLGNIRVDFSDLAGESGAPIAARNFRCFNLGGTNWLGQPFSKQVNVETGLVQPLWIGLAIPRDAVPQVYRGRITVTPENAPARQLDLHLEVLPEESPDSGDSEVWKHSRLRWLDSTLALDDEVCPPFVPISLTNQSLEVLGRRLQIAEGGLLDRIESRFSRSVDRADAAPRPILSGPMRVVAIAGGQELSFQQEVPAALQSSAGHVRWAAMNRSETLEVRCDAALESDGYINFRLAIKALTAAHLDDIRLEVPLRRDVAVYMMGLGYPAGRRPLRWDWKWSANANNVVWLGDVEAGLCLKLKPPEDRWDLCWIPNAGYDDWANEGKGGCSVTEAGEDTVLLRAFTGPRFMAKGEGLALNFGLLATPVKPLDRRHWNWRHYQAAFEPDPSVPAVTNTGATILNIHSGQQLNPYINYPFLTSSPLSAFTREAHEAGLKVKPYYTVRELSNHAVEFWALRSLNFEILADGAGAVDSEWTGTSWLTEHVISRYQPGWQHPLPPARYDAAVLTTGLSRWMNYYVEGLNWLARNVGLDGLYLDGIGYDREVLKRIRKVLLRARPDSLIDFHSGNNFGRCGNISSICQYAEHLPYVDSLWFGEFYDPNESPDFWLLEMSGIPFGLFGEMLESCGNPWRGMLYGMSARIYQTPGFACDPRNIWKLWDEFGIAEARMIGYWDEDCPVRPTDAGVLATAYVRENHALIALASWQPTTVPVRLEIDGTALGLNLETARLRAPEVAGLQSAAVFRPDEAIPVPPGKGWLLILEQRPGEK